jgi:hypothetical protein
MDRLQIHYRDHHTFHYSDRPEGGVQIDISIPYSEAGDGLAAAGSVEERLPTMEPSDRTSPTAAPTVGYT